MGTTASRLVRGGALLPLGCSAVALCCFRRFTRRLRRYGGTIADGTSHPSAMKLVGVNLTAVGSDVSSLLRSPGHEFTELRLLGTKMHTSFFHLLEEQTNLRVLVLRDVEVDGEADLSFLKKLYNLENLVIDDCHDLTSSGLHTLLELPKLKRLVLGIESLTQPSEEFCASCVIELSLVLYGPRCLNDPLKLRTIQNLVSIKFVDFWTLEYPIWITDMPKLSSLSFENGTVRQGQTDYGIVFPASMKRLSCVGCHLDRQLLDAMLHSGTDLVELELDLPQFSQDVAISCCSNLHVLRVSAKECDGEVLQNLLANKSLRVLELGGCYYLSQQHLFILHTCQSLEKVSISCSCVGHGGCDQLASLNGLQCLEFHCCLGINLHGLCSARGLRSLVLDKCLAVQGDMNEFLASLFVQGLDSLYIEEF